MQALTISSYTLSSALGHGLSAQNEKLQAGQTGLARCTFDRASKLDTWVGEVSGLADVSLPTELSGFDCRNNRLSTLALAQDGFEDAVAQAAQRYGRTRIGVYIGTSTSGIYQTELAYRSLTQSNHELPDWYDYKGTHNTYSCAEYVRRALDLQGPCSAISTACSSSAKVFASAHRAIESGFCDAAVVGGIDSLCLTTLFGFHALQLVSSDICRPADSNRQGLSIGEAGGFALLEKADSGAVGMQLLGYGESGDAYHMSAPHPEGLGATLAMSEALRRARLDPTQIGYINLHGTGTPANDLTESMAVTNLFGEQTPCSSTKGFIGHTLGAAGIAEAVLCLLALEHRQLPPTLNTRQVDPAITCNVIQQTQATETDYALSNSFGFGGSNATLILGRGQ